MRLHAIVSDLATAQAAVKGGATVIQLRLKGASTEQVVAAGAAFRELDTTLVVNDDVHAAIALGADGVHLGRDDPGAEAAIAAGLLLGTSASSVDEAKACSRNPSYETMKNVLPRCSGPPADPPNWLREKSPSYSPRSF